MPRGKFISLEGGEGAGKSTQIKRLSAFLKSQGVEAVTTREVGGSPSAEEIRELWLGKGEGHWDPMTEVMLIMAARREHLVRTIWPALHRGAWVVSDRFVDSTRAYQGVGLGLGVENMDEIFSKIAGDFWPDLTLLFDLPVEVGLQRMNARCGQDDRYQQKHNGFHETLRKAYLGLAEKAPNRFRVIDASKDENDVAKAVEAAVTEHFGLKP